jgi:hypothetical protein
MWKGSTSGVMVASKLEDSFRPDGSTIPEIMDTILHISEDVH